MELVEERGEATPAGLKEKPSTCRRTSPQIMRHRIAIFDLLLVNMIFCILAVDGWERLQALKRYLSGTTCAFGGASRREKDLSTYNRSPRPPEGLEKSLVCPQWFDASFWLTIRLTDVGARLWFLIDAVRNTGRQQQQEAALRGEIYRIDSLDLLIP